MLTGSIAHLLVRMLQWEPRVLMAKSLRASVTLRALTQRINRRLAQDGRQLRAARGGSSDLGAYYIVDPDRGSVVTGNVDPEKLGRELGVLKSWERLDRGR